MRCRALSLPPSPATTSSTTWSVATRWKDRQIRCFNLTTFLTTSSTCSEVHPRCKECRPMEGGADELVGAGIGGCTCAAVEVLEEGEVEGAREG